MTGRTLRAVRRLARYDWCLNVQNNNHTAQQYSNFTPQHHHVADPKPFKVVLATTSRVGHAVGLSQAIPADFVKYGSEQSATFQACSHAGLRFLPLFTSIDMRHRITTREQMNQKP